MHANCDLDLEGNMAGYRDVQIVLAEGKQYSRPVVLERLGLADASPDAEKQIDAVSRLIDQDLSKRVSVECVFGLLAGGKIGQVIVKAIEEPKFDEHAGSIGQRFSKEFIEKVF